MHGKLSTKSKVVWTIIIVSLFLLAAIYISQGVNNQTDQIWTVATSMDLNELVNQAVR
ncbi:MAG: hypothetical protein ACYDH2_13805 [Anaerolineaceae bacterium]